MDILRSGTIPRKSASLVSVLPITISDYGATRVNMRQYVLVTFLRFRKLSYNCTEV